MPAANQTVDNLRARAAALRLTARRLDDATALDLYRRAGPDVWEGVTPRRCLEDLLDVRRHLLVAADDLRHTARALDDRATQIAVTPVSVR